MIINDFYLKINDHINLVESYSQIKNISKLIKSCRLKPKEFYITKYTKLVLYKNWVDEYNNSISILTNKKINICYNDLSIDKRNVINTDLYYGLPLNKIAKISKCFYLSYGKDDGLNDICLISFLGIDSYIRTYLYLYNEWSQVSPLLIGINNLELLSEFRDVKFKKLTKKENISIPCADSESWLSCIPIDNEIISSLRVQCNYVVPIFN